MKSILGVCLEVDDPFRRLTLSYFEDTISGLYLSSAYSELFLVREPDYESESFTWLWLLISEA